MDLSIEHGGFSISLCKKLPEARRPHLQAWGGDAEDIKLAAAARQRCVVTAVTGGTTFVRSGVVS